MTKKRESYLSHAFNFIWGFDILDKNDKEKRKLSITCFQFHLRFWYTRHKWQRKEKVINLQQELHNFQWLILNILWSSCKHLSGQQASIKMARNGRSYFLNQFPVHLQLHFVQINQLQNKCSWSFHLAFRLYMADSFSFNPSSSSKLH